MPTALACEQILNHRDFQPLASLADISVDLRYGTPQNFVGRDLYGDLDCAWLHRDAAEGIASATAWLAKNHPGYRLLILDALRPHRVQIMLWDYLAGTALQEYVANPARGSIHSFGMAVDVTLIDANQQELDMGSAFDDLSELSHPALETLHLETGRISPTQVRNRQILRDAMFGAGFRGLNSEWWHFDFGDRDLVRQHYQRVD